MIHALTLRRLLASLLCSVFLVPQAVIAQPVQALPVQPAVTNSQEQLTMLVGDILEILPAYDVVGASHSWILTQGRTFIKASRDKTFRDRLTQPGEYTLLAEILSPDRSTRITRTFLLSVQPRETVATGLPESTIGGGSGSTTIVSTDPVTEEGFIFLPFEKRLVKLTPLDLDRKPLGLDANTSRDGDNDGRTDNDIDNEGTFFQTYASPLYIWFAEPFTSHGLSVTTVGLDGNAMVQTFTVYEEEYARREGLMKSPVSVTIEQVEGREFRFSAEFQNQISPSTPLLYNWEFGDGEQSLLATPTHTYAADGDYTVRLRVRNLSTSTDVAEHTQLVSVESMEEDPATDDEEVIDEPEDPVDTEDSASLRSILILLGVFIACLILGALAMFIFVRLRRRKGVSLENTFANLEQTLMKKDGAAPVSAVPPLEIKPLAAAPAPKQEVVTKREEERASAPAPATPTIEEKNAPSWLKKGLNAPTVQATTPTSAAPAKPVIPPAPAPTTPPAVVKPVTPPVPSVAAKPVTPPTPQPQVAQQNVPEWLKPKSPTPAATPTPAAAPSAIPAPAPTPLPPKPVAPVQAAAPQVAATQAPEAPKPATPPPAPVVQKPMTPPVVQTPKPAAPVVPVQTTTSTPAPVTPKPAVPVAPPAPPAPKPVMPPVAPKPVAPPVVQTPVPTPTPAPTPAAAAPINPPAAPKPVPPPLPPVAPAQTPSAPVVAQSQPQTPVQNPTPPVAQDIQKADEPIAFIRADSLDQNPAKKDA